MGGCASATGDQQLRGISRSCKVEACSDKCTLSKKDDKNAEEYIVLLHKLAIGVEPAEKPKSHHGISWTKIQILTTLLSKPGVNIESTLAPEQITDFSDLTLPARPLPYVTPLMQAVIHKNVNMVNLFMRFGANVNATLPCEVSFSSSRATGVSGHMSMNVVDSRRVFPEGSSVLMISL
jgi:Ankyrin repeat